jgi:hypothetical protein
MSENSQLALIPKPQDILKFLVNIGMKEPSEVMVVGKGDIAFDIDGHDFYLKQDSRGGFRFHVHGERRYRCKIGPNFEGLATVLEHITQVLQVGL